MSDIRRYTPHNGDLSVIARDETGEFVTYADHVEALRQAEQRGYDKGRYHGWAVNAECCGSCPGECEQRLALAEIKGDSDE